MFEEAVSALILNVLHMNLKFTFLRTFLLQQGSLLVETSAPRGGCMVEMSFLVRRISVPSTSVFSILRLQYH